MRNIFFLLFFYSAAYGQNRMVVYFPDSIPVELVKIPAGSFMMGSPNSEFGRDKDESPQLEAEVPDFWMGIYEITQAQWLSVMGYNPATFKQRVDHLSYPIETITWLEAQVFIRKLNQLNIGHFRLPTEAEWEYACRAGTQTAFYWGPYENEWSINKKAWINSRSMGTTHSVGIKDPNPWGLHDMTGNAWEWTSTTYHKYGEKAKNDSLKVFRGGSWFDFGKSQRSANRHKHRIDEKYSTIGLRLVWSNE
ncbi:MAG: formylglycine-generating enzyme family protein [Bacteroidota bacterium]